MSAVLDYDTGPLNWVRSDIEALLQAALGRVQAFSTDADLTNALRLARDDTHQVAGALRMVGLEGAATVASALENSLAEIHSGQQASNTENLRAVRNAIEGLSRWIKEVAEGRGSGELALFPLYRRLREFQGAERVFEGELFFPDLRARVAVVPAVGGQSGDALFTEVKAARAIFQRGLLAFLRGRSAQGGLEIMRDALATIECVAPTQASKTFWWACVGLVECLIAQGIEPDFHVKQLLARIDLQMRRLMEGSPQVAERLLRDALFFVAKSQALDGRAAEVRATFTLDRYLPGKAMLDPETLARMRPVFDAMKTELKSARDSWHRYVEDTHADHVRSFRTQMERMQTQAELLESAALSQLLQRLAQSAEVQARLAPPQQDLMNLEIASTLLFLQNAVESEDILQEDFSARAQGQSERLQGLAEGRVLPHAMNLLDTSSQRAAERDMLHHVASEVGANLKQVEEMLDAFFRDPDKRAGLLHLPLLAAQSSGALAMLELDNAAELLVAAVKLVEPYLHQGYPDNPTQNRVADALSSLGLFIEAHCAGRLDAIGILQPVLTDFGLPAPKMPLIATEEESVEAGLNRRKAGVAAAYLAWRNEGGEIRQKEFQDSLIELGRDAELIDDPGLKRTVDGVLAASRAAQTDPGLDEAVSRLTGESLPQRANDGVGAVEPERLPTQRLDIEAPLIDPPAYGALIEYAQPEAEVDVHWGELEPVVEAAVAEVSTNRAAADMPGVEARADNAAAQRQAETSGAEEATGTEDLVAEVPDGVEPELLEIFLEEAVEVLASMREGIEAAYAQPDDRAHLALIRRGFHTLKGSGRMVGLTDLGEAAWGLEHFMNGWLAEDKPAGHELLALLSRAHGVFSDWIEALQSRCQQVLPLANLSARVERVAHGLPCEPEAPAARVEEVSVADENAVEAEIASSQASESAEEVVVGGVHLSSGLFQIFLAEAEQRLATLRDDIVSCAADGGVIGEAARRATHTLAGIAGTAGFPGFSDLAHGLELYLNRFENRPLPQAHQPVVNETVLRLQTMLAGLCEFVEPQPASDLIAALGELQDDAQAGGDYQVDEIGDAESEAHLQSIETEISGKPEFEIEPQAGGGSAEMFSASVEYAVAPVTAVTLEEISDLAGLVPKVPIKSPAPVFERREVKDEIDPQLLPIFLEEAETLVAQTSAQLRAWKAAPSDHAARDALRRNLHTLKGSARMTGAMRLGELTHVMESRVVAVIEGEALADRDVFESMETEFDRLANALERLKQREPIEVQATLVEAPVEPVTRQTTEAASGITSTPLAAEPIVRDAQDLTLRVRADWVDRMVNQAGEVAIARSRIESEIFNFKRQVGELSEALTRLRGHIREVEIQAESQMQSTFHAQGRESRFDPLEFDRFTRFQEVTRFLAESVNDISTVQHILLARLGEADAALLQQARLNRELQQNLLRVRMVPLYSVAERLYRTVRQTARDVGKRAQLDIRGGELEIDRSVLEKVTAPIEHLLRNALAHGIESPEIRRASGKTEFGEITLSAAQSGNEMRLTVKDDGTGLNYARIREKALARGLLTHGIEPSEAQLAQFIFAAGFSTAESVSEVSGRGVGMDVVKNEIAALGGRIDITSQRGVGTEFNIYLPLTLAVTQAVIVNAAKEEYALPTTLVQQVLELKPEPLAGALAAGHVEWRGERFPLTYLPHLLGHGDAVHEVRRFNPVVLMRSGNSLAASLVDSIEGTREIVVKNIGPQLARVTGIAGATVRGDGRVILILNPVPLAQRWEHQPAGMDRLLPVESATPLQEAQAPMVLVVDDSLTVRKISSRLLAREGFRVDTAKDGVDALEKMHDLIPDVVLLDVEMPRMDGFELARVMKNDPRLASVPIIMITSRTAEKHRNHALKIGVNIYLGKPYQEQQLLDHIAGLLELNVTPG